MGFKSLKMNVVWYKLMFIPMVFKYYVYGTR